MKRRRRLGITGMAIGSVLMIAPMASTVKTYRLVMETNRILEKSGVDDPNAIAAKMGELLLYGALGMAVCVIGGIMVGFSLILYFGPKKKNQPPPLPLVT